VPAARRDAVEGALLEREVGVQADVRGALLLVTQSQRDGGGVDPGAQQRHRCGVAQDVHRDALGAQRRAVVPGGVDVLGESAFDRRRGSVGRRGVPETRPRRRDVVFACPDSQHRDGLAGERDDAFLSSLAGRAHVRPGG
jgi:hypothetical protein